MKGFPKNSKPRPFFIGRGLIRIQNISFQPKTQISLGIIVELLAENQVRIFFILIHFRNF